jgi:sterol desaturase/sphingolipid hydroxylase (fatty acid hydroxylase superfamily)
MNEVFTLAPAEEIVHGKDEHRRRRVMVALTFVGAVVFAVAVRPRALIGIPVLFLVFVPIEKLFARRPQRVFRRGLFTDLTHLLVNSFFVGIAAIVLAVVMALPLIWLRRFAIVDHVPTSLAIALSVALVFVGNYWGHRLTHRVPLLWRFHAVHHSIEQMDWVASGRLHPLDSAFTQAVTIVPLFLLGYSGRVFASVGAVVALLALFQHANVRLRFPFVRWIIPTPEWHHWHHAIDAEAHDKNFGLPVVDKLFGTAYLPKGKRPVGFGTTEPVPKEGYFRHLVYPFTRAR